MSQDRTRGTCGLQYQVTFAWLVEKDAVSCCLRTLAEVELLLKLVYRTKWPDLYILRKEWSLGSFVWVSISKYSVPDHTNPGKTFQSRSCVIMFMFSPCPGKEKKLLILLC